MCRRRRRCGHPASTAVVAVGKRTGSSSGCARLGEESVYGLTLLEGHRPERTWALTAPPPVAATAPPAVAAAGSPRRPLWLLLEPQPLSERAGLPRRRGALRLLSEPERIESGWWDGRTSRAITTPLRIARGCACGCSASAAHRTAGSCTGYSGERRPHGRHAGRACLCRAALPFQLHLPARRFASARARAAGTRPGLSGASAQR